MIQTLEISAFEISNDEDGVDRLARLLHQSGLCKTRTLMVLEPTGGYEMALWIALVEQGYQVRRVDAKQVRHFAKAKGLLSKTDRIDARVLRDYACTFPNRGTPLTDENHREIKALVARRHALVDNRKAIRCRMKQNHDATLLAMDHELETLLTRQIESLEKKIARTIMADDTLNHQQQIVRSIPGIGPVMGWMLLAHMPELGTISDKKIAALAGVAPFAHDSGRSNGKRFVQMGRRALRNVLYQAALVASHHNPDLKAFAGRLKKAGKPHKVIITAVARKLVSLANTLIRQNRMWTENRL